MTEAPAPSPTPIDICVKKLCDNFVHRGHDNVICRDLLRDLTFLVNGPPEPAAKPTDTGGRTIPAGHNDL